MPIYSGRQHGTGHRAKILTGRSLETFGTDHQTGAERMIRRETFEDRTQRLSWNGCKKQAAPAHSLEVAGHNDRVRQHHARKISTVLPVTTQSRAMRLIPRP